MRSARVLVVALASAIAALLFAPNIASGACNIVNGKAYGDCANVRVNTGSKGPLKVRGPVSESGIIKGATIFSGGSLTFSGISNGDILINKGGTLRTSGVINGTIRNLGGQVEIEGTVSHVHTDGGRVVIGGVVGSISGTGDITYKRGAVVSGTPSEITKRVRE